MYTTGGNDTIVVSNYQNHLLVNDDVNIFNTEVLEIYYFLFHYYNVHPVIIILFLHLSSTKCCSSYISTTR